MNELFVSDKKASKTVMNKLKIMIVRWNTIVFHEFLLLGAMGIKNANTIWAFYIACVKLLERNSQTYRKTT